VSWFWTRRLPTAWLTQARLGAIGVHPSLLPRHRGPDPYYAAIDQGDELTGVSVHILEPEYDTGAVLGTQSIPVGERNTWQLARALDRPSLAALRKVVREFAEGRPPRGVEQKAGEISYAPAPQGDGLKVCWDWETERILRRIRALSPVPGLALSHRGLPFFVTRACRVEHFIKALRPSEAHLGERLVVRTSDGAIAIEGATLELGEETQTVDGRQLAILLQARPTIEE
jgi:methionyl-tRNA formyltransferase